MKMKGVTNNCLCVTPEVTHKHISVTPEGLWISTSFLLYTVSISLSIFRDSTRNNILNFSLSLSSLTPYSNDPSPDFNSSKTILLETTGLAVPPSGLCKYSCENNIKHSVVSHVIYMCIQTCKHVNKHTHIQIHVST